MKSVALALILALGMTGCSSKQERQQGAYEKYIRKSGAARAKQRSKFQGDKPKMPVAPMPSEPVESTESGPQSAPPEESPL